MRRAELSKIRIKRPAEFDLYDNSKECVCSHCGALNAVKGKVKCRVCGVVFKVIKD